MNKKTWFRAYMWALVCVLVSLSFCMQDYSPE